MLKGKKAQETLIDLMTLMGLMALMALLVLIALYKSSIFSAKKSGKLKYFV